MNHRPHPGSTRRRVVMVLAALMIVALASVPAARHALISLDLYRGRRALADVDLDAATQWLLAAEGRQPDRADVQYWLAVAYRRHAKYGLAHEHLQRAQTLGWSKRDLEQQQMMLLFQMGDLERAEPYLKNVLERGGSDDVAEDAYEAMTIGYIAEHRLKDATLCLDYWIAWRPDSLRARLLRAYFHSTGLPNLKGIETELRQVLRISPRHLTERLALVEVLLQQTKVDEALAECEICRRQAPHDPRVQLGLGMCHFRQGRMDEAKLELDAAVALVQEGDSAIRDRGLDSDQLSRAFTTLGQIASSARDFASAARYCEEALKQAPHEPSNAYALGIALKALKNETRANHYLELSKTLRSQAERLSEINMELGRDSKNVALRVEAATLLLDQGRKGMAAGWMASALRIEPKLRIAHEALAEVCEEQGATKEAQRHRDAARNGTELASPSTPDGTSSPAEANTPDDAKTPDGANTADGSDGEP